MQLHHLPERRGGDEPSGGVQQLSSDWPLQGGGDFNGDGKADVLYRDSSTARPSLLCSGSRGEACFYGADRLCVGGESFICAELGAERETTVDQTLMRGLVTAFRVFVSGLSSV
jgi:hypothetical protein